MKIIKLALFTTLAMALSWAERFVLPIEFMPGFKPGIANIVTIIILVRYGLADALWVVIVRSLLSALLFGGVASLPYSLFGGILATISMSIISKLPGITLAGVGIIGAFFHNLAQVTVAVVIMNNIYIYTYMGILGVISIIVGAFTGIAAKLCIDKLPGTII